MALPHGAVRTQLARCHGIFLCSFCSASILAAPSASCPLLFLLISCCMCSPLYCCLQILGFLPVIDSIFHSLCFCFYACDVSSDKPWAQRVFPHHSPDTSGPVRNGVLMCAVSLPFFLGISISLVTCLLLHSVWFVHLFVLKPYSISQLWGRGSHISNSRTVSFPMPLLDWFPPLPLFSKPVSLDCDLPKRFAIPFLWWHRMLQGAGAAVSSSLGYVLIKPQQVRFKKKKFLLWARLFSRNQNVLVCFEWLHSPFPPEALRISPLFTITT